MPNRPSKTTLTLLSWLTVLSCAACTVYKSSDRDFFDSNGFSGGPTPKISPTPTPTPSSIESIEPRLTNCQAIADITPSFLRQFKITSDGDVLKVEQRSNAAEIEVQILRVLDQQSGVLCTLVFTSIDEHSVIARSRSITDQFVSTIQNRN